MTRPSSKLCHHPAKSKGADFKALCGARIVAVDYDDLRAQVSSFLERVTCEKCRRLVERGEHLR